MKRIALSIALGLVSWLILGCGSGGTTPAPTPSQHVVTEPAGPEAIDDPITPQVEGNQRRVSRDE